MGYTTINKLLCYTLYIQYVYVKCEMLKNKEKETCVTVYSSYLQSDFVLVLLVYLVIVVKLQLRDTVHDLQSAT